jgi:hypothetical protein
LILLDGIVADLAIIAVAHRPVECPRFAAARFPRQALFCACDTVS